MSTAETPSGDRYIQANVALITLLTEVTNTTHYFGWEQRTYKDENPTFFASLTGSVKRDNDKSPFAGQEYDFSLQNKRDGSDRAYDPGQVYDDFMDPEKLLDAFEATARQAYAPFLGNFHRMELTMKVWSDQNLSESLKATVDVYSINLAQAEDGSATVKTKEHHTEELQYGFEG